MESLHFLYRTVPGRMVLKVLTQPSVSEICGRFLDSSLSKCLICPFVKKNQIDLSEYELEQIGSFNDFFSRKIKEDRRSIDRDPEHLIAPCDGLLSVWKIEEGTVLPIKQSHYTVSSLLRNEKIAKHYQDGYCLVFRLCVDHYHRYCYVDSGKESRNIHLPGIFHTVRPVALDQFPVYTENSREYTVIKTDTFGPVVQMEVGAMLVGRIVNYKEAGMVFRGEEKGMFQYGGSTIVLLVKKDRVKIRQDVLERSRHGIETPVKMGEVIGHA